MTRLYPPAVDTAQMEQEYAALYEGVALVDNRAAGRLYLHDRDRTRLLHRLSTNDIEGLQPGQGTRTVLTNHNGRIIDLLTVHLLPVTTSNEPPVLLVTSAEQRQSVRKLLHRNIFFGDRLQIEDISESLAQLMLYGPHSCALVQQLLGVPAAALPRYDIMAGHLAGIDLFVSPVAPIGGCGFALYIPVTGDTGPSTVERIWQALLAAGAQPVGPNTLMTAWVEAGYATYGRELSLEYIPLETGLMDAMSFTKGCYDWSGDY
ncbi:MAG: hypothetical protein HC837_01140 [Chloroflexaceae bacterium]|nr:hypothetical protein [Chloroflexaceae bacterium]